MPHVYVEIYKIVQSIPRGRVLTYGLISHMIGGRMSAQGVGWALKALGSFKDVVQASKKYSAFAKNSATSAAKSTTKSTATSKKTSAEPVYNSVTVPWQRVVNAQGGTSTHKVGLPPDLQREMLEAEGIVFDDEGKLDLNEYLWKEGVNKDWNAPSRNGARSFRAPKKLK